MTTSDDLHYSMDVIHTYVYRHDPNFSVYPASQSHRSPHLQNVHQSISVLLETAVQPAGDQ